MGGAGVEAGVGDIIFFRVPNSLEGCDGWGEGRGILYLTLVHGPVERYTPLAVRVQAWRKL
jgi:hypothetical protein